MQKYKNLKEKVEYILDKYPKTRDCDTKLTVQIWHVFYPEACFCTKEHGWVVKVDKMLEIPKEDNVSRVRRKIQETGKYPPTCIEVVRKRKFNEKFWRENMQSSIF